jgi:hypothetical protein
MPCRRTGIRRVSELARLLGWRGGEGSGPAGLVRSDVECQKRRGLSGVTWGVHRDAECPARRSVSSATFNVQRDAKCPARRSMSSATPSVRRDAECQKRRGLFGRYVVDYVASVAGVRIYS